MGWFTWERSQHAPGLQATQPPQQRREGHSKLNGCEQDPSTAIDARQLQQLVGHDHLHHERGDHHEHARNDRPRCFHGVTVNATRIPHP